MTAAFIPALLAGLCLLAACLCDLRRFEIPNRLSVALLVLALAHGILNPPFDWGWHAMAVLVMFGVGAGLFALGWMGGGDIKLMVAMAAWTGLSGMPAFLIGMTLAGGVLASFLIVSRMALAAGGRPADSLPGPLRPQAPLPYAIAITAGAFWWAPLALF